jgi:hypothetical protein
MSFFGCAATKLGESLVTFPMSGRIPAVWHFLLEFLMPSTVRLCSPDDLILLNAAILMPSAAAATAVASFSSGMHIRSAQAEWNHWNICPPSTRAHGYF